jgi:hypothetical protein
LVELDTFIIAETRLLGMLRRRLALYEFFPGAERPPDLLEQVLMWTRAET